MQNLILLLFLIILCHAQQTKKKHHNKYNHIIGSDKATTNDVVDGTESSETVEAVKIVIKKEMSPGKPRKYFYYVPDGEGLISQLRRADLVWNIANTVDRIVYTSRFMTSHFVLVPVSLCEIFDMPSNFTCVDIPQEQIFTENYCNCPTTNGASPTHYRGFPADLDTRTDFDYRTIECVAGGFRPSDGKYPKLNRIPLLNHGTIFVPRFLQYLPILKKILGISSQRKYNAIHWRRDDILKSRCKEPGVDTVNCASAQDFINKVVSITQKFGTYNKTITYVSTDEKRVSVLNHLQAKHMKVFERHLADELDYSLTGSNNNHIDKFIFELMLQMDAHAYFAWGRSSVHQFICEYRLLRTPERITVIEDEQITSATQCHGFL